MALYFIKVKEEGVGEREDKEKEADKEEEKECVKNIRSNRSEF